MFSAIDHFDACCVGIHTAKVVNCFAALQPIAHGLEAEFGTTGADAGRGLALRRDHGLVAEPQTHGVTERFNRTLKKQAIHGRLFRNIEEVRQAITEFRNRYHRHGRFLKLGFSCHPLKPASLMPP